MLRITGLLHRYKDREICKRGGFPNFFNKGGGSLHGNCVRKRHTQNGVRDLTIAYFWIFISNCSNCSEFSSHLLYKRRKCRARKMVNRMIVADVSLEVNLVSAGCSRKHCIKEDWWWRREEPGDIVPRAASGKLLRSEYLPQSFC